MAPTIRPYPILLLCPPELDDDEHAGHRTFLAHVEVSSVAHAIATAQDMAATELDCEDLSDQFESLLVIARHHDALL
jgi:hypothetical protein